MNKIEKLLQEYNNSKPEWSYPQLFADLKNVGVLAYVTDVSKHSRTFDDLSGTWTEESPEGFKVFEVSDVFSLEDLQKALKRRQEGITTYTEFLAEIAKSGVATFKADMKEQTVTYYDISGSKFYVQQIPQIN